MPKQQQQPPQQHSPQQPTSVEILQLQLNQQIQQQNQPLQQQVDRAIGLVIPDLSTVTRM
jgi:hypothetical protein